RGSPRLGCSVKNGRRTASGNVTVATAANRFAGRIAATAHRHRYPRRRCVTAVFHIALGARNRCGPRVPWRRPSSIVTGMETAFIEALSRVRAENPLLGLGLNEKTLARIVT